MDRVTFANRTVIVTGSGNGLGAEYARLVARRGGRVVVNDIDRAGVAFERPPRVRHVRKCDIVCANRGQDKRERLAHEPRRVVDPARFPEQFEGRRKCL